MRSSPPTDLSFTPAHRQHGGGFFQSSCYCCQSPSAQSTPSKGAQYTLIANVPYDTVRQDLVVEFRKFGRVELAMVVCDEASRHPHKEWTSTAGYAFVRFSKRSEAAAAIQAASMGLITIRGARVRADWAKKDSYAKRGRVPPAQGGPILNTTHGLPDGLVALHMLQQAPHSPTSCWTPSPRATDEISTAPTTRDSISDGLMALHMLHPHSTQQPSTKCWSGATTPKAEAEEVPQVSGVLQAALQSAILDALTAAAGASPTTTTSTDVPSPSEPQRRRKRHDKHVPSLPIRSKQVDSAGKSVKGLESSSSSRGARESARSSISPMSSAGGRDEEPRQVDVRKGAHTPDTTVDSTCETVANEPGSPRNYGIVSPAEIEDAFGPLSPADFLPLDLLSPCSRGLLATALRDVQAEDGEGFTSGRYRTTDRRSSPEELLRQALVDFSSTPEGAAAADWSSPDDFGSSFSKQFSAAEESYPSPQ